MPRLIVTADDFGLSESVNEAVEHAFRHGILTSASLMVTAPAADDAVRRARRLPGLGVGLHLVLVDGRPALPAQRIPDLVGPDGRFPAGEVGIGSRLFFSRRLQRQAEAELRAQVERFLDTGLELDHVNAHHHFHQHPTVLALLLRMAREYGIRRVRVPIEPFLASWRAQRDRPLRRALGALAPVPRVWRMRARLRRAGICSPDHMFGLHESGGMDAPRLDAFLRGLPREGVSEVYCHPATGRWQGPDALPAHYRCVEEYRAIADPHRRRRLVAAGVTLIPYAGLERPSPVDAECR